MVVQKVDFGKGKFDYSIEYEDGKTRKVIATSEEPREELKEAVKELADYCKTWLSLDSYNLSVKLIKFNEKEGSPITIKLIAIGENAQMNISVKTPDIKGYDGNLAIQSKEIEHILDVAKSLAEIRNQFLAYISGVVSQQELDFDNSTAPEEVTENDYSPDFLDFGGDD